MTHLTKLIVAAAFAASTLASAQAANVVGQAYKSPADCIADYGTLDTDNDGRIDADESNEYIFIRENVDVDGDGVISDEEKRVACERGIAKAFRSGK